MGAERPGTVHDWPKAVQARLSALAAEVEADDHRWHPPHRPSVARVEPHGEPSAIGGTVFLVMLVALTVGVWLIGLVAIARIIFR